MLENSTKKYLTFLKIFVIIFIERKKKGENHKMTKTQLNNAKRNEVIENLTNFLEKTEDVLRVASNKIAFPTTDAEGNEIYVTITVSIPKGEAYGKGEEYDGYSMAESYKMKIEEQRMKAEQKAKEKERKIARDKERREKKGE